MGDGGAVLTNSSGLADRLKSIRQQGQTGSHRYRHCRVGGNFRLDAIQAAILRIKLRYLDAWTEARRAVATYYRSQLQGVKGVALPPDTPNHVYSQFVIRVDQRDELRQHLDDAGVQTAVYYPLPLHLQHWHYLDYRIGSCPHAERAAREVLALPCNPTLSIEAQQRVVEEIQAWCG